MRGANESFSYSESFLGPSGTTLEPLHFNQLVETRKARQTTGRPVRGLRWIEQPSNQLLHSIFQLRTPAACHAGLLVAVLQTS